MESGHKVKLTISTQAAVFLKAETPREEKLRAARGEIPLDPADLVAVLLYLSRDKDSELKGCSVNSLKRLGEETLMTVCTKMDTHPFILDVIARIHHANSSVAELIAIHPNSSENTLTFLAEHGVEAAREPADTIANNVTEAGQDMKSAGIQITSEKIAIEDENDEPVGKYQFAQGLAIKDKIKLALTGDKEWRMIFIKDNNKVVSESVLKNPRITEQEVLLICKSSFNNDEIIRIICANKEWTKNPQIRKALIENNKTPLNYALRFISCLGEKDLAFLAKNKNVSSVIATQARRLLFNKKYGK